MIDEFLLFIIYNAINHGFPENCCSGCCLIIETILFLLGHEWDKVCIYFINIWFFAPGFECLVEKFGCVYIVVAEAKKLIVVDYLIAFFCELFSIIELLKDFSNFCGWIPTCSHAIGIGYEVGRCVGSVFSAYVTKKSKWFKLTNLGNAMCESGHVFFWTLVSDHGDSNNANFIVGGDFFFVIFVEAYDFSDLGGCADGIDRSGSRVC